MSKIEKTDEQWRSELSEQEYEITRNKGTEPAFTGVFWDHKGEGQYLCKCCGAPLFESTAKYDSGSGWPSFYQAGDQAAIDQIADHSHGMVRVEVTCATCDSHLGHLFEDGPAPTGQRYCINSASLDFQSQGDND